MAAEDTQLTAVVMGQGYVGLPVAQAAVAAGVDVCGFEVDPDRVRSLNSGISHVDDLTDADVAAMVAAGYRATDDPAVLREAEVVVICVPTPLDENGGPDLRAVQAACTAIGANLSPGTTVILESTTYPGTTEDVVLPALEAASGLTHTPEATTTGTGTTAGTDADGFFLAFSPERIDPGSKDFTIVNTPKLVGGLTTEATEKAAAFYRTFVETVVPLAGAKEAETAKLLENTYRHVNIALVNEMARFCHDLGIDIWEVIRGAATKPFGFQRFTPGPGVGGHCIPIDPNYLSFQVKKTLGYQFRFVELAQEINNSMPAYVAGRIADLLNDAGKPLNGAKILLLGVTYKPNIADQRESPAIPVAEVLAEKKAHISFHDPLVEHWHLDTGTLTRVDDLDTAVAEADIVVLLQGHTAYDLQTITTNARLFFDTRGGTTNTTNTTGTIHHL